MLKRFLIVTAASAVLGFASMSGANAAALPPPSDPRWDNLSGSAAVSGNTTKNSCIRLTPWTGCLDLF